MVDTTGAGDGFVSGLLENPQVWQDDGFQDENLLRSICRFANAVGAFTSTQRGTIPALPTAEEVAAFLATQPALA